MLRNLVLHAILDNEQHVNEPGVREGAWITTANYAMQVRPGGMQRVDGRDCVDYADAAAQGTLSFGGTLWVDAKDGEIVQTRGEGVESSSVFTVRRR